MSEKACTRCGETKPLTDFPPHLLRRDGRQSWCRECYRVHMAAKRQEVRR